MATAIVSYVVVGLVVGLVVRLTGGEDSSLVGLLGGGAAGALAGGVVANLLFSGGIELDIAGWLGSVIGSIVVVLILRTVQQPSAASGSSD